MSDRLAALFDRHADKLYRLARRLTNSADQAHDLVQETFLRAARALSSIPDAVSREEAWLVRVLVNVRRDEWRRAAVERRAAALLSSPARTSATPESTLVARRAVWDALDTLSPRRRAVVVLSELDGIAPAEIAGLLGIAVMTVRWHLSMAKRELRRALAPHVGKEIA